MDTGTLYMHDSRRLEFLYMDIAMEEQIASNITHEDKLYSVEKGRLHMSTFVYNTNTFFSPSLDAQFLENEEGQLLVPLENHIGA